MTLTVKFANSDLLHPIHNTKAAVEQLVKDRMWIEPPLSVRPLNTNPPMWSLMRMDLNPVGTQIAMLDRFPDGF